MAKFNVINGEGIIPEGIKCIENAAFEDCESTTD